MKLQVISLALVLVSFPLPSFAADSDEHSKGSMELHESMDKSHKKMEGMTMTGDTDKDFARMMASHHRSGIEMAEIEAKYGKDPELKALAKKIIQMQNEEIRTLEKHS